LGGRKPANASYGRSSVPGSRARNVVSAARNPQTTPRSCNNFAAFVSILVAPFTSYSPSLSLINRLNVLSMMTVPVPSESTALLGPSSNFSRVPAAYCNHWATDE